MQADGLLDDDRAALRVIHDPVKVLDVTKAIAAQGEGVGAEPKALRADGVQDLSVPGAFFDDSLFRCIV